jgi:signal transduction histidine kinase
MIDSSELRTSRDRGSMKGGKRMSSRHSVLITGASLRIGVAVQKPFRSTGQRQLVLEDAIRLEERYRERARIVRELHNTLLQGFLGACMLLHQAMEQNACRFPF